MLQYVPDQPSPLVGHVALGLVADPQNRTSMSISRVKNIHRMPAECQKLRVSRYPWRDVLAPMCGHENGESYAGVGPIETGARHSQHSNVENRTSGLASTIGREKLFRRREGMSGKTERAQQARKRLPRTDSSSSTTDTNELLFFITSP